MDKHLTFIIQRRYPMSRLKVASESSRSEDMFQSWTGTSPHAQNDIKRRRKTPPSTPAKEGTTAFYT